MMERIAIVASLAAAFAVGTAPPADAAASTFGPGDSAWNAYYASPSDTCTWAPFCQGGGGHYIVAVKSVPACGPVGTTEIALPNGGGPTDGFQCVELAERYLYVKFAWGPMNSTNGAQVVKNYGKRMGCRLLRMGLAHFRKSAQS